MKASGIYAIRNRATGSEYIGSAANIRSRWAAHRHALAHSKNSPPKLQCAWNKYGAAVFDFLVLETCDKHELLVREQHYIDQRKPRYNTRLEARSNFGVRWSAATNRRKGRPRTTYTVRGVTGSLRTLVKHFGQVREQSARSRMARGMSVEAAVTTPPMTPTEKGVSSAASRKVAGTQHRGRQHEFRGMLGNIRVLTELFSEHSYYVVKTRMQRGMSLEDALLTPLMRVHRHG